MRAVVLALLLAGCASDPVPVYRLFPIEQPKLVPPSPSQVKHNWYQEA